MAQCHMKTMEKKLEKKELEAKQQESAMDVKQHPHPWTEKSPTSQGLAQPPAHVLTPPKTDEKKDAEMQVLSDAQSQFSDASSSQYQFSSSGSTVSSAPLMFSSSSSVQQPRPVYQGVLEPSIDAI